MIKCFLRLIPVVKNYEKKSLNSGDQQFYQYQQHEQLQCTSHIKPLNTKNKYDGNPGLGLETEIVPRTEIRYYICSLFVGSFIYNCMYVDFGDKINLMYRQTRKDRANILFEYM